MTRSRCKSLATTGTKTAGFTLLEVLIALTIFAAIATVVSGTTSQSTETALYLENRTMASWIAENRMAEIRLNPSGLAVGDSNDTLDMANREWRVNTKVINTEMDGVLRVTISVSLASDKDYSLATLATVMGTH